jgi:hypothetical protein
MMNRPFVGVYIVASLGQVLLSVPARAQSTPAPPAPQTQAPAPAPAGATVIGEDYRIDFGSPLNTGAFTVRGPYIGGAVRF